MKNRKYIVGIITPEGAEQIISTYTKKSDATRMEKVLNRIALIHSEAVYGVFSRSR